MISWPWDPPSSLVHLDISTVADLRTWVEDETDFFFLRYGDAFYYCDSSEGFVFRDMSELESTGGLTIWKALTEPLGTLDAALDYPLLKGESIRERFDEVEFLTD